jgi:hypothetical protein
MLVSMFYIGLCVTLHVSMNAGKHVGEFARMLVVMHACKHGLNNLARS